MDSHNPWHLVASQLIRLKWSWWCVNQSKDGGVGWILLRALGHLQEANDKLRSFHPQFTSWSENQKVPMAALKGSLIYYSCGFILLKWKTKYNGEGCRISVTFTAQPSFSFKNQGIDWKRMRCWNLEGEHYVGTDPLAPPSPFEPPLLVEIVGLPVSEGTSLPLIESPVVTSPSIEALQGGGLFSSTPTLLPLQQ